MSFHNENAKWKLLPPYLESNFKWSWRKTWHTSGKKLINFVWYCFTHRLIFVSHNKKMFNYCLHLFSFAFPWRLETFRYHISGIILRRGSVKIHFWLKLIFILENDFKWSQKNLSCFRKKLMKFQGCYCCNELFDMNLKISSNWTFQCVFSFMSQRLKCFPAPVTCFSLLELFLCLICLALKCS